MENNEENTYGWIDWEHETDFPPGREGVYFLTIVDPIGEEIAIIVHRTDDGKYPTDSVAQEKVKNAQRIVDALNATL